MVTINDLLKTYNRKIAVEIPHLEIANGIIGLVGNNGVGKTTLFRLILDLVKADKGEVFSNEKNVSKNEEWKTIPLRILMKDF